MFTAAIMAAAVALGYTAAILISLVLTFAVTLSLPRFVKANHLIRNGYKLLHEGLWLLGAAVGGYLAALLAKGIYSVVTELLLMAALIWILWTNTWEARQRGIAHQILITACTVIGVAGGYVLQGRMG